ncbi:MAG: TonB-dependent receptor [Calditrichales bacterium]|nr:TonB-dependent receptor [Calditrichales bacterium]
MYKKKFRQIFLFVLLITIQVEYVAAKQYAVTIRDLWTGKPLPAVNIIYGIDTLRTDASGLFKLVENDGYSGKLHITYSGYFGSTVDLSNLSKTSIYLTPIENTAIITVVRPKESTGRLMLPAHVSRINVKQITGINKISLQNILTSESGILIKSYGSSGQMQTISLRGMSAGQTQVLFDDIPLNDLQLGSVDFSQYSLNNLDRVEIYRGGNTLFGGSGAVGGVINLHPESPAEKLSCGATFGYTSYANKMFSGYVNVPYKQLRQRLFIEKSYGDNEYKTGYNNKQANLKNRDYDRITGGYYNEFQFSDKSSVRLYISTYKNQAGSPKPYVNEQSEQINLARIGHDQTFIKIKYLKNIPKGSFYIQTYLRNEWMDYSDPSANPDISSLHFNQEKGFQIRGHYLFRKNLLIHSGLEAAWQKIKSSEAGKHQKQRYAPYILFDWVVLKNYHWIETLHINGSARLEAYSNSEPILLPGIGFSINRENFQIYFSAGKNYRAPTFNDLYWAVWGNPELRAERSINTEAGFDYYAALRQFKITAHLGGYMNHVTDQVKWAPTGSYWQPVNIREVYSRGLEWQLQFSDQSENNSVRFNYTYGLAEKDKAEFEGDQTAGNQLPYLPRELWNVSLQLGWKDLHFILDGHGSSFRYLTIQNDPDQIIPSYHVWRFGVDYQLTWQNCVWKLSAGVENLLNKEYAVMPGYPMPPRNYRLTVSMDI